MYIVDCFDLAVFAVDCVVSKTVNKFFFLVICGHLFRPDIEEFYMYDLKSVCPYWGDSLWVDWTLKSKC